MASPANHDSERSLWSRLKLLFSADGVHYSIVGVCLWYLLLGAFMGIISQLHQSLFPDTYRIYWYYDPPFAFLIVILVVSYFRPALLAESRWRVRWRDILIGLSVGLSLPVIVWFLPKPSILAPAFGSRPNLAFVPVVCLAPLLEEIVFRGAFLRSLTNHLPAIWGILVIALLDAFGHHSFWLAFPLHLALCTLYILTDHSLPASITAHIANNALAFVLAKT